ncbi:hypothetical protein BSIN_1087 [Burkholderia singularis]|uniref:Uncharacterized protein n=1 Tax=Burkholderia singularis TaxID=1503053 RepID=A0A238HC77_9BURK|nr:hypothetical protein BSIN_1087 [Burkholderia singularis]
MHECLPFHSKKCDERTMPQGRDCLPTYAAHAAYVRPREAAL